MKPRPISVVFLLLMSAHLPAQMSSTQTEVHNFSVRDDIAMVRFSDPSEEQENFNSNSVKYSPDGSRVAIVTTRGLLDTDEVESTISVFDLGQIDAALHHSSLPAPKRHVIAVIVARPHGEELSTYAPMIRDLRWSADSRRLYFKAMNSLGAMQLDEVSADGGNLRRLTPVDYSVDRFDVANNTVVFTAAKLHQPHPPQGDVIDSDSLVETGYKLKDILFPGEIPSYYPETFVLGVVHPGDNNDGIHQVPGYEVADIRLLLSLFPFRLSPDGHRLIAETPLLKVPEAWKAYDPNPGYEHFRLDVQDPTLTKPDNGLRPRQYTLIDLVTGKETPLVNGPNARTLGYATDANAVAWSPDGSRVLVTNVFLPLEGRVGMESATSKPCVVASIDLPSMNVRCILFRANGPKDPPFKVHDVSFSKGRDQVDVSLIFGSAQNRVGRFCFRDGAWTPDTEGYNDAHSSTASRTPGAQEEPKRHSAVYVRQALNDPPTLWVVDTTHSLEKEIWNPNPQLASIRFGEASVYQWKDRSGEVWTGALVKPVGYVPGKRYPLVVQMYQFHDQEFLTDGTAPTAFAARHLASYGFMVLQIRKKPSVFSEVDPQTHLEGYRSAVESLSSAGLIDSSKVGVVGFSWTCWYVVNALIKAPKLFAAATIADGLDSSYMQYMLFGPGPANLHLQMDRIRGGSPLGPDRDHWFKDAPGFHLDQVEAPVRIEAINPSSVLQEWELYSSLYMQRKPVDLIYFPEGTHVHQRPLERLESQQGDIDWLRFWLQKYEDPDPRKRGQYARWEAMAQESLRNLHHSEDAQAR